MEQSRRVFIGSTAALGSAAIAGAGLVVLGGTTADAQQSDDTLVVAELHRLAKDGVRSMRTRPGEGARRVASSLRIFAAHGKGRKMDQLIAQQLRKAVRRHGREAFLLGSADTAMINGEMRALGITRSFPTLTPDPKLRAELLDDLLAGKFSSRLTGFAEALERQSVELERAGVGPLPVRRIPGCVQLEVQLMQAESMMLIFCNPIFSGVYAVTCVFWSSFAATTWLQMQYYGC